MNTDYDPRVRRLNPHNLFSTVGGLAVTAIEGADWY